MKRLHTAYTKLGRSAGRGLQALKGRLARGWACLAASRGLQWEAAVLGGLVLCLALTAQGASYARVARQVRQDTLRLHVQARSDSPADQLVKLRVRDEVLRAAGELFGGCPNQRQAAQAARAGLPRLQAIAEESLARQGQRCGARAQLVQMEFAPSHYETFDLPGGEYQAVRISLGGGRGHNWFCVLYPGLCLPAAQGEPPAAYPTAREQALVSGGWTIEFAAAEACRLCLHLVQQGGRLVWGIIRAGFEAAAPVCTEWMLHLWQAMTT